jgi:hypothetical protein
MRDTITHGHLMACTCGGGKPCQGWYAPPEIHYASCPNCGTWIEAATADLVTARWNRRVEKAIGGAM